jgi:Protein of unknown function (DUF2612)/PASTA domain
MLVPNIIGLTADQANTALIGAGFLVGVVVGANDPVVPLGVVLAQDIDAGTDEPADTPVGYTVSNGPSVLIVPDVLGMDDADARAAFLAVGMSVATTNFNFDPITPAGEVTEQNPTAGLPASPSLIGAITVSLGPEPAPGFNSVETIISQYANSPTLDQLVANMDEYIDQTTDFAQFYSFIWNVDTAQGFGLDIWGSIVGISRLLEIPSNLNLFGFQNALTPPGVEPFNFGVFNIPGGFSTSSFLLSDDAYRILILTKALSNISATTAPAINQILQNLFPGRGNAYVLDLGGMAMQYTFEFELTLTEFAILSQSGALPHPAGVLVTIVSIPASDLFGFAEALPNAEPLGFGVFYAAP